MTTSSAEGRQANLVRAARKVMQHAYAPYSRFKVGAAVLLANGEIITGCNVENASFGLTNCAERNAIFAAVAQVGAANVKIKSIAIVNSKNIACSPCGACRQVMAEFARDATIYYQGKDGIKSASVKELLPDSFSF